jgi:hypothetical protein
LLAAAGHRGGANHYGRERPETRERKAERIVHEEWDWLGWSEADLRARRRGHCGKVRLARQLRQETTMSLKWIAEWLGTAAPTHVACRLHRHRRQEASSEESVF